MGVWVLFPLNYNHKDILVNNSNIFLVTAISFFQGKVSDMQTEVKQARSQGKYIVSDYWLEMCLEKNERLKEELYASTYNPKMSLDLVPKERRSTRSTVSNQPFLSFLGL